MRPILLSIAVLALAACADYSPSGGAYPDAAPIRINEIVPDGDRPGGFVELYNPTDADVDMSDWQIGSNNPLALFRLPAGATIAAHGFLVINEVTLPFGLQPRDGVHLFSPAGIQVDGHSWLEDPGTGFARCPDGTGPLVIEQAAPTRRAANECS